MSSLQINTDINQGRRLLPPALSIHSIAPHETFIAPTTGPMMRGTLEYVDQMIARGDAEKLPPVVLLSIAGELVTYDGNTRLTKAYQRKSAIPCVLLREGDVYVYDYSGISQIPNDFIRVDYESALPTIQEYRRNAINAGILTYADQLERAIRLGRAER